ncbi:hypothetical protein Gasu2_04250 [Galdieria sulphuraria]|nr:hypothetical protein Gasu2_04250 [Galdieria sulphuraria]
MRHSSSRDSASSRSFYERTRWSSRSSTYREKNFAKQGYVQTGSDRDDFARSFYPKRGPGSFKGAFVERKEESSRIQRPYKNYHKKENSPYLVKVWVRNLPPSYSEDDFHMAFESAGHSFSLVAWCQFYPGCPASRKETLSSAKKGFAYLAFQSLEDALGFEKEYSGLKLKDTNNGVEYGIRVFRALFPKVPSKFRCRDSCVATIFEDADFRRFEESLNGTQDEREQSEGNLSVINATSDSDDRQCQQVNNRTQSVSAADLAFDKGIGSQERTVKSSNGEKDTIQSNIPTKQRYSQRITEKVSSSSRSRLTPRYRVKSKTEQGQK